MRPLSTKLLGSNGISCVFSNGQGSSNTGYFTKQLGTHKFVATDGTISKTVTLAQSADEVADLAALSAGLCTITCTSPTGQTEHIRYLTSKRCVTVEGNSYPWTVGAAPAGHASISTHSKQPDFYSWLYPIVI